jgi:hypothetical protein
MKTNTKKNLNTIIKAGKFYQPKQLAPKNKAWEGWTKRICIAVPTTGVVRIEWMMARFGQVIPCNWSNGDIYQYYDQFSPIGWDVANSRNVCVEYFISQGFEWLLFLDHDTLPPPDCFLKLTDYMNKGDIPIVSGLYYCKGSHPEPLIFRGRGNSYYNGWKKGEKVWVDGLPCGCLLMHRAIIKTVYDRSPMETVNTLAGKVVVRKVFETPRQAWFDVEQGKYQSQVGTEDLYFFDRLKKEKIFENCGVKKFAKYQKMQYPLLCDTGIFCSHISASGQIFGKKEYERHK